MCISMGLESQDSQAERGFSRKLIVEDACAQVIQKSGWQGLYRGLQASLLGTAMSQGVYFYFYSLLRQVLHEGAPAPYTTICRECLRKCMRYHNCSQEEDKSGEGQL